MCHCLYFCRETDVIMPQLEEDELHHGSGQEQNRTYSTRPVSTELKPINLTANGHPSVSVKEVRITLRSSLNVDIFSKSIIHFEAALFHSHLFHRCLISPHCMGNYSLVTPSWWPSHFLVTLTSARMCWHCVRWKEGPPMRSHSRVRLLCFVYTGHKWHWLWFTGNFTPSAE